MLAGEGKVRRVSYHVMRVAALIKNEIKFSSYIRKFRREPLQSHMYSMTNGLLIYD